jgi:hypothetical protein
MILMTGCLLSLMLAQGISADEAVVKPEATVPSWTNKDVIKRVLDSDSKRAADVLENILTQEQIYQVEKRLIAPRKASVLSETANRLKAIGEEDLAASVEIRAEEVVLEISQEPSK